MDIGLLSGRITLEDSATSALKTFSSDLTAIGGSLTKAGSTLTMGLTAPLVAAAGASLLFSSNFEASMTRLVSLAGVSQEQLAGVKQHILDLAPATGIGPQALAEAMMKVSSTVSDTKVALEILDMSAKGAAAGMGEAKDVAGAITAVVNSYGKENITAARAADILTKAVQDGGAEAKELAPTLANIVPIAAQMGVSFEEVGANLATLTKLGVPASEAVTSLTSIMTALLKETAQGKDALASVGLTFDELRKSVKEKGLAAAMTDLTQRFGENKSGLTDVFGRIEALKNIMGTAGQQTATYAQEVIRMTDSVGSLDKAFDAMKGTQLQTWGEVSAALQVAAIKFGDSLAPAMGAVLEIVKPLLAKVSEMASWFAELPTPVKATAIGFVALLAALGPVLVIAGTIMTSFTTLLPVFALMGTAFTFLTGPIAILTSQIGIFGLATGVSTTVTLYFEKAMLSATTAAKGLWAAIAAHPVVAVTAAIGALTLAFVKWKSAAAEAALVTQTLGAQQDVINKAIAAGAPKTIAYADAIAFNNESFRKASGGAMSLSMAMAELQSNSGNTHTQIAELNKTVLDLAAKGKLSTPVIGLIGAAALAAKIPLEDLPPALRSIVQSLDNAKGAGVKYVSQTKEAIEAAKAHADALKGISDQLSGRGLLANAKLYEEALKAQGGVSTLTNAEQLKLVGTYKEVIEKYEKIGGKVGANVVKHFEDLLLVVNPLPKPMAAFSGVLANLPGQIDKLPLLTTGAPGLTIMGDQIKTTIPGFIDMKKVMDNVNDGHKLGTDRITAATPKYVTLKDLFKKTGEEVHESFGVKAYNALGTVDGILSHIPGKFSEVAQVGVRTAQAVMGAFQKGDWIGGIVAGVTGVVTIFTKLWTNAEKAVNPIREAYVQAAGGLHELDLKAKAAGLTLDAVLNAKNPEAYKKAIDDLNGAIKFQDDSMKVLDATVAKYGFTIGELGPAFAAQKLSEGFAELWRDTEILKAGGIDYEMILGKQAEKYQSLVGEAMLAGVAIPLQMKPVLADMIEMGLLTDAAGLKLTDISQLTFSETLDSKFQTLIESIGKLVDAITRGLGGALTSIPQPSPIDVTFRGHWQMDERPDFDVQGMATGGLVTQGPWHLSGMGTDTTMRALTPGEGVVTTTGMSRIGVSGLDAINTGNSAKPNDELHQEMAALRRSNEKLARFLEQDFTRENARAIYEALQDGRRH